MAFCHIPNEKCSKLNQTAEKGYLVGYRKILKAYKTYIPSSRKIVVRQNANFMEDRAFRKSQDMPAEDQAVYVLLVQQQQGQQGGQAGGQTSESSTMTSASISS